MKVKEEKFYQIYNRKYLGSKSKLLDFLEENIFKNVKDVDKKIFVDLFGGTGVVSDYFSSKFNKVIINDFLISNKIIFNSFFSAQKIDTKKLLKIKESFNSIEPVKNTYFAVFGNKYFSKNDADKIGTIRCEIDTLFNNGKINLTERDILISSLLFSVDKIANSMGHYEIYIDRKIEDKFSFQLIDIYNRKKNISTYCEDANKLIRNISGDVLYLDPPYNSRQYSNLYHVLETLVNWDNPILTGKGLKPFNKKRSLYSLSDAKTALLDLILNADFKFIFLSYNNTNNKVGINSRTSGKISHEDIFNILSLRGKVSTVEIQHKKYDTGNSTVSDYKEILYICKVNVDPIKKIDVKYPFNYMGGKFKLLKSIKKILDNVKEKNTFIDLFAGGANVGVNSDFKRILCYDINKKMIDILNYIKNNETFKLIDGIESIIKKYDLSLSSKYGYKYYSTTSSIGLKKFNNDKYLKLRNDYNKNKNILLLIVLIIYSFNNSMNFNNNDEFNIPCGKRDFNNSMKKNLILFSEKIKNIDIEFIHSDFMFVEEIVKTNKLMSSTFYMDPPYIVGYAHYNKIWNIDREKDLLNFIDKIASKGKWILSNSLEIGNNKNDILYEYIDNHNELILYYVDKNYDNSWFHKKKQGNIEIILTNIK